VVGVDLFVVDHDADHVAVADHVNDHDHDHVNVDVNDNVNVCYCRAPT